MINSNVMGRRGDVEGETVSDGGPKEVAERSLGESELNWEIASSLLKADSYTDRALEEHVFQMSRQGTDLRGTEAYLREALEQHREIVAELEYALEAVEE